jgi:hypothetical protein
MKLISCNVITTSKNQFFSNMHKSRYDLNSKLLEHILELLQNYKILAPRSGENVEKFNFIKILYLKPEIYFDVVKVREL